MSKRRPSKNKNPFERKYQHSTSFAKSTVSSEAKSSKPITKKPTNSSVSNNASSKINTSGSKRMPITSDKKLPKEPLSAEKNNIQEKVDHLDQSTNDEIDSSAHHASDRVNGTHIANNNVLDNSDYSTAAIISNNKADEGSNNKKELTSFRQKLNYVFKKILFKKHTERK